MRAIHLHDIDLAARVLVGLSGEAERREAMARMLAEADLADRYRKRTHRLWHCRQDGSLAAAARETGPVAPLSHCDREYLRALIVVAEEVERFRARREPPLR